MDALRAVWISLCLLCISSVLEIAAHSHLDAALNHYEKLHVDHVKHSYHSPKTGKPVSPAAHYRQVDFHAFGRKFQLRLSHSRRVFSRNFAAYVVDGKNQRTKHPVDLNEYYSGYLHGEDDSTVTAHIDDRGILLAFIRTPTETYHIEPSHHYIKEPHPFHMVAYRSSDVKKQLHPSRLDYVLAPHNHSTLPQDGVVPDDRQGMRKSKPSSIDTEAPNPHLRLRRQSGRASPGEACRMILVADHKFFAEFASGSVVSIIRRLATLVSFIDIDIYTDTEWIIDINGNTITNLGLEIEEILVHSESFNSTFQEAPTVFYNSGELNDTSASELLTAFNYGNWEGFCLAHLFTFRNFDLLGLANIASPIRGQTGGICSQSFIDPDENKRIIFNTGLSSFMSGGRALIVREEQIVTAHELGHNWGSHHDPGDREDCRDIYLMNGFAQDGSQDSHRMFSICSRTAIGRVLIAKGGCFEGRTEGFCGDYVVQGDERCDAGPEGDDCCTSNCAFTPGSKCSDVNSICCEGCDYRNVTRLCRSAGILSLNCSMDAFCDGSGPECPDSEPAEVGTMCFRGQCQLNEITNSIECMPICNISGQVACTCDSLDDECRVCCQDDSMSDCLPVQIANQTLDLSNGAMCSTGVCMDGRCTETPGFVTRFWRIISDLSADEFARFLSENIVGTVLTFTAIFWIIAGSLIHFLYDQKVWKRFIKANGEDYIDWFDRRLNNLWETVPLLRRVEGDGEVPPPSPGPSPSLVRIGSPVDDQPLPPSFRHYQPVPPTLEYRITAV